MVTENKEDKEKALKLKVLEEKKKRAITDCCRAWNEMISNILLSKKLWENYQTLRLENNLTVADFDLPAQKILYLANPHGEFDFLIEDLVTHRDLENYLKTLIIK